MADTKASAFTALTAPATGDGVPIIDDYGGSPEQKIITLLNLFKIINGFTEDTAPDKVADFVVSYDASASAVKKVLLKLLGSYCLHAEFAVALNPADSTAVYWGSLGALGATTGATLRKLFIPRAGKIIAVYGYAITTAPGTGENNTIAVRLNDTTSTTVTSTLVLDASLKNFSNDALGIAVAAGDFIEMVFTPPAYATNPTGVYMTCEILIA